MHLLYHSNNFWKAPWKSSCVSVSMTFITASFISSIVSWWQPLSLGNNENATDLIWRVLASCDGISSWTPLKPQHSNPNRNPLAHQLWSIDFLTDSLPSLNLLCHSKTDSSLKHSIWFCGIFPSLKQNFIAYRSSKVSSHPDCIFEIHQLWLSGFSRVYSNCCCSCSFECEILKICQSSHKMYSNNIVNFQESMTILNASTKKSGNLLNARRIWFVRE